MTLTTDQEKALVEIKASYEAKRDHVLMGYAGTGKSYLCDTLVRTVYKNPLLCSPTNKAAKVLSDFTGRTVYTLASVLCLRLEKGNLIQYAQPDLGGHDVVIIDECSMIGSYYTTLIKKFISERGVPVLYVGDPEQLPPVKEEHEGAQAFKVKHKSLLTQIVRQAEGNPLIAYSMHIREHGFAGDEIPRDGKHIKIMPEEGIIEKTAELRQKGVSFVVAGWRNREVDRINYGVHECIYGKDTPEYAIGEEIVFQEPLVNIHSEVMYNNSDVTIIKHIELDKTDFGHYKQSFRIWRVTVGHPDFPDDEDYNLKFLTLHRDDKQRFQNLVSKFFQTKQPQAAWAMLELVTEIKHTYAMTCHKLQGSSYDIVAVLTLDLLECYNADMRRRLAYVAVTRPRKTVAFLI